MANGDANIFIKATFSFPASHEMPLSYSYFHFLVFVHFPAIFFSLSSYWWSYWWSAVLSLGNAWSGPGSTLLILKTPTRILCCGIWVLVIFNAFGMRWPPNQTTFVQLKQSKLLWSHIPPWILTCCFAHKFKQTFIYYYFLVFILILAVSGSQCGSIWR